ncbi:MAG: hypothetical protein ABIO44_09105, partial [Saprospiraceae bacterium]
NMVILDTTRRIKIVDWAIYNRWGAKIFAMKQDVIANPVIVEWDGTYKGNPAPSDTYIVKAVATDINGFSKFYSEMFTLVR